MKFEPFERDSKHSNANLNRRRCNESTLVYEPAKYPDCAGNNVSHLKFPQIQSSFKLETKVVQNHMSMKLDV